MEYIQIILLSIIQGLTEFLPISSSGHLILAPLLFDFEDQGLALDAILHLGTLLAIVIFFRSDLSKLLGSLFDRQADPATRQLAVSILLASFPAGVMGLFGMEYIESHVRVPQFIAINLLVWSVVFYIADKYRGKQEPETNGLPNLTLGQVMLIGFAQAIALLPGTSRSGITIAAGLFSNLTHTQAARFSFLLGTPIILAAGLHSLVSWISNPEEHLIYNNAQLGMGFLVSFAAGYLSIKLLLKIVAKVGLMPFIIYRVILAIFILGYFWI
ncbi:MAG: undecaprenyl-diphosphatase [Nitrospinaceae bacterium]|nr:MAG: undecaprenyl-diphosphatase [Nitrospinaceae bacterium]